MMDKLDKVKEALEFYARSNQYSDDDFWESINDVDKGGGGIKAKEALQELKQYRERLESAELVEKVWEATQSVSAKYPYAIPSIAMQTKMELEKARAVINVIKGEE